MDNSSAHSNQEVKEYCISRQKEYTYTSQISILDRGTIMGTSKRICPNCGRKMKQQFIGLFHCKCGTSWRRDIGFFERTPDMVFSLERKKVGNKVKQLPTIRHK